MAYGGDIVSGAENRRANGLVGALRNEEARAEVY